MASPRASVFGLAARHLRHEWVLTACLVSALAAVVAPLLVLLGLKEGTIETLRERLVQDPVYREIRPAATQVLPEGWLESMQRDPRVAFVIPTILPASSVVYLAAENGRRELTDLVPTAAGDPLLLENGGAIPGPGQCVLSGEAAKRLGVQAGDRVTARVTRSRGGRSEAQNETLEVLAVLEPRAGSLPRVYTDQRFVLDVESYKEGRGVPARGWPGETARPYLSYDGVVVVTPQPLDPITRTGLAVNTGLLQVEVLRAEGFAERFGFPLPDRHEAYDLWVPSGSVGADSLRAVAKKLRGRDAQVLPYVRDLSLDTGNGAVPAAGLSPDPARAAEWGLPPLPWGGWDPKAVEPARLLQAFWPADRAAPGRVGFAGAATLNFPLQQVGEAPDRAWIPAELAGVLRTARERAVAWSDEDGDFVLQRAGFRGFRLYAASIDPVPELAARLEAAGIPVIAEVAAIRRIQALDRGLTRLFWLVAVLGIVGAGAVLVASLYAAVERERRDLGVLRLIGFSRGDVFWFPVFQGTLIATLGVLVGLTGYTGLCLLINRVFGQELAAGEAICRLPPEYPPLALAATLLLAVLSSLVAAWRATRIEPAEAIREE